MIAPDGRFQFRIVEIKNILYSLFKGIDDRIPPLHKWHLPGHFPLAGSAWRCRLVQNESQQWHR